MVMVTNCHEICIKMMKYKGIPVYIAAKLNGFLLTVTTLSDRVDDRYQ
jgi:hypothetical protein